eukprot:scaffold20104_cov120-Isochrysis_galbana.AAC.11
MAMASAITHNNGGLGEAPLTLEEYCVACCMKEVGSLMSRYTIYIRGLPAQARPYNGCVHIPPGRPGPRAPAAVLLGHQPTVPRASGVHNASASQVWLELER